MDDATHVDGDARKLELQNCGRGDGRTRLWSSALMTNQTQRRAGSTGTPRKSKSPFGATVRTYGSRHGGTEPISHGPLSGLRGATAAGNEGRPATGATAAGNVGGPANGGVPP